MLQQRSKTSGPQLRPSAAKKKKKNHDSWASTVQTTEHNPHLKSDYSDTRFSAEAPITSPTWNLLQLSCLFKPSPRSQGHSVAFPAGSTPPAMWSFPSSSALALKAHVCHLPPPPPHTHTYTHAVLRVFPAHMDWWGPSDHTCPLGGLWQPPWHL